MPVLKQATRKGMLTYDVYYCIVPGFIRRVDVSAKSYGAVDAEFERLTAVPKSAIRKRILKTT